MNFITNPEKGFMTTPFGEFMYVNITGQGKPNFQKTDFNYVASVIIAGKEAKAVQKEIDDYIEENKPKKLKIRKDHKPYKTHKDNEKIPKGSIQLDFKTGTTFASGDKSVINIYNGKKQIVQLTEGTKVGNGSVGRISGKIEIGSDAASWWCSFWLNSLQLKTFVEYEENSGFDEIDDAEFENFEESSEKPKKDKKKKKKKKKVDE